MKAASVDGGPSAMFQVQMVTNNHPNKNRIIKTMAATMPTPRRVAQAVAMAEVVDGLASSIDHSLVFLDVNGA